MVAGCTETHCVSYDSNNVIAAVKNAELTFICLGTGNIPLGLMVTVKVLHYDISPTILT